MNKCFWSTIIASIIVAFFVSACPVHADEYDEYSDYVSDPVQEELIQEPVPEVISELPVTIATPDITTPVTYNFTVVSAVNDLRSVLVTAAADHDTEITFPDSFDIDVSDYFDIIFSQNCDREYFRSIFISLILDYLGFTPDHPLYDYFYEVVGNFYDNITGLSRVRDEDAALTLAVCCLGSISLLGFVKWVI